MKLALALGKDLKVHALPPWSLSEDYLFSHQ